ncbi:MAG: hypothetical protein OXM88_09300 [bacterium]|nr:hypothetical protein [bacterium]
MADSFSGSGQYLSLDGIVVSGPGNGFSGLNLPVDPSTFQVVGGGQQTTHDGGTLTASGSFTCVETDTTNRALLGKNGARVPVVWRPRGQTGLQWAFNAIITRSRTFTDRGERSYSATVLVDGAPTRTTAA